jgi:dihydrofolate reductase
MIAYGGATFDQALSRLGLVDEYRLMIRPAALGAGLPLFKDLHAPLHLELEKHHISDRGRHLRLPAALDSRRSAGRPKPTRTGRVAQPARAPAQAAR